jgi:hypothetical protein
MKLTKWMPLLGVWLGLAAVPASAIEIFQINNVFDAITPVASMSRTPIYRTDRFRVEPLLDRVTKIRVRNLDQCGRSPVGLWSLDSATVNGGTRYTSPTHRRDSYGGYDDFDVNADIATVEFSFSTLDSSPYPCRSAYVELWHY